MRSWLSVLIVLATPTVGVAQSKPAIAPGKPTAGFAVAVIAEGFDYTRAGVAARFARDGEGEAIAYDAADDDRRPYAAAAETSGLIETAQTFVVPIRTDGTKNSWVRAVAFLKRSPARVVVILAPLPLDLTDAVLAEFKGASDRLLLLPARTTTKVAIPHALTIAALPPLGALPVASTVADLVLAPATATREMPGAPGVGPASSTEAAMMAPQLFGCIDVTKARGPADVAVAFVAKGQRGLPETAPIIEMCAVRR